MVVISPSKLLGACESFPPAPTMHVWVLKSKYITSLPSYQITVWEWWFYEMKSKMVPSGNKLSFKRCPIGEKSPAPKIYLHFFVWMNSASVTPLKFLFSESNLNLSKTRNKTFHIKTFRITHKASKNGLWNQNQLFYRHKCYHFMPISVTMTFLHLFIQECT